MTRKNQVDDLLARFERKSITQKKCPYCAPINDDERDKKWGELDGRDRRKLAK